MAPVSRSVEATQGQVDLDLVQADPPEAGLQRRIGLVGAVLSGTGVIVGAGIYALIGEASALAGGATWVAFAAAAGVASLTGLSYARMGRRIPRNSPEFQYAAAGLGERAGFLAGWLMLWADLVATAAVALGFGGYASALLGVPRPAAALALVALSAILVWWGIRESVLVVGLLSALEVAGLLVVIVVGLPHWGSHSLAELPSGTGGLAAAVALVFFAYIGFDELGNLAEEMHRPERDLPLAIFLSVALSALLYVLVAVSAVSLVGWQSLAGSAAPLGDAVAAALGRSGGAVLELLALGATGNTVLLLMVSGSRSLHGMARAGVLPSALGHVGKRRTPEAAILLAAASVSVVLPFGTIALVAQMANAGVLTSFVLVNLSAARVLSESTGRLTRQRLLAAIPPLLGAVTSAALAVLSGPGPLAAGMAIAGIGLVLHTLRSARRVG